MPDAIRDSVIFSDFVELFDTTFGASTIALKPHTQKDLSAKLEECRFMELGQMLVVPDDLAITKRNLARVQSCAAPHSSGWLLPKPFDGHIEGWFTPQEFDTAIHFRLGLPLMKRGMTCRICNNIRCDELGDHTLTCMNGGARTRLHNKMRDTIFWIASEACMHPRKEEMCFGVNSKRTDILLDGMTRRAVDVAITHFAVAKTVDYAMETPGGAATHYEATVKARKYGALAADNNVAFFPLVFDTMGAIGESGIKILKTMAHHWAKRFATHSARAIPVIMQRISSAFMKRICNLLCINASPESSAVIARCAGRDMLDVTTNRDADRDAFASTAPTQDLPGNAPHSDGEAEPSMVAATPTSAPHDTLVRDDTNNVVATSDPRRRHHEAPLNAIPAIFSDAGEWAAASVGNNNEIVSLLGSAVFLNLGDDPASRATQEVQSPARLH